MYELTMIKGLIKRGGMAAFAIAMLLSLSALRAQAQAGSGGDALLFGNGGAGGDVIAGASVGFAGQTVRIRIEAADASTASLSTPSEQPDLIVGPGCQAHV